MNQLHKAGFDLHAVIGFVGIFGTVSLQQISSLFACLTAAATFAYMAAKAVLTWSKIWAEKPIKKNDETTTPVRPADKPFDVES